MSFDKNYRRKVGCMAWLKLSPLEIFDKIRFYELIFFLDWLYIGTYFILFSPLISIFWLWERCEGNISEALLWKISRKLWYSVGILRSKAFNSTNIVSESCGVPCQQSIKLFCAMGFYLILIEKKWYVSLLIILISTDLEFWVLKKVVEWFFR